VAACTGATAIVHNFFALEGFHIAEALGCISIAASPCMTGYTPPTGYQRSVFKALPALEGMLTKTELLPEFLLWMWPLFSPGRWAAWRQHSLGLPAMPQLLQRPLLLYGEIKLSTSLIVQACVLRYKIHRAVYRPE
jgi:hypothetical protein